VLRKVFKNHKFFLLRMLNRRRYVATQVLIEFLAKVALISTCGVGIAQEICRFSAGDNKKLVRSSLHFIKYRFPWIVDIFFDVYHNPVVFGFNEHVARKFYSSRANKKNLSQKYRECITAEIELCGISQTGNDSGSSKELSGEVADLAEKVSVYQQEYIRRDLAIGGNSDGRPASKSRLLLEAALRDFYSEFADFKKDLFLISGTFLGVVREGHLLDHDYDIDLGIMGSELLPELEAHAKNSDIFAIKTIERASWGFYNQPCMLKLIHKNGVNVDVFVHVSYKGLMFHGGALNVWFNSNFSLTGYTACGVTNMMGPSDSTKYLIENYGAWWIEKKDFDYNEDTPNYFLPNTPFANYMKQKRSFLCG
jgi:hypothetical protein